MRKARLTIRVQRLGKTRAQKEAATLATASAEDQRALHSRVEFELHASLKTDCRDALALQRPYAGRGKAMASALGTAIHRECILWRNAMGMASDSVGRHALPDLRSSEQRIHMAIHCGATELPNSGRVCPQLAHALKRMVASTPKPRKRPSPIASGPETGASKTTSTCQRRSFAKRVPSANASTRAPFPSKGSR